MFFQDNFPGSLMTSCILDLAESIPKVVKESMLIRLMELRFVCSNNLARAGICEIET